MNEIELLAASSRCRNKARRNRFYERFGFVFNYADSRQQAGMSRPLKAVDLTSAESWKENIPEHRMFDFLTRQQQFERRARAELATLSRSVQGLVPEQRRAQAHPVWWAVVQVYEQRTA